jgi:RES domain-containing protein
MSGLTVWRLCGEKYADTAFSGLGAKLYGGRWSPPGAAITYCSESRALAALEVLAQVDDGTRLGGRRWVCISALVPDDLVERPERVPAPWRQYPHTPGTPAFGAEWVRTARSAALRVPSALVPGEFNYLLNPAHPEFPRVKLRRPAPFFFDQRLVAKARE